MTTMSVQRVQQRSALPSEITDAIIDHLHTDVLALCICSSVCSEWVVRSRHHVFYRVQLWPWRLNRFLELANEERCTFTNHVRRIEMDDAMVKTPGKGGGQQKFPFKEAISQPHPPCFDGVQSIQICNVDWTLLSIHEQAEVRGHLAKFVKLDRLEFRGVFFHDLRELVRIVDSFPILRHLTANVSFKKYTEHVLVSAHTLGFPRNLISVELGTDDGIPVVLGCLASNPSQEHLRVLNLQNIKPSHYQYLKKALGKIGKYVQDLTLGFANEIPLASHDGLVNTINLSRLNELRRLILAGLVVPQSKNSSLLEESLPVILDQIDSPFLDTIELHFRLLPGADLQFIPWKHLERVLLSQHFFGMQSLRISVDAAPEVEKAEANIAFIYEVMPELHRRGVLTLEMISGSY